MRFKMFLIENAKLPDLITWVKGFFENRMDPQTLQIYADWLEENGQQEAADFFHRLVQWRNPKLKKGPWQGSLISPFYDLFGYFGSRDVVMTESGNSWFFHPNKPSPNINSDYTNYYQMARHIVYPGETSYRMSLSNGQWSAYTNNTNNRASVVSTRHQPTEYSERHYPRVRVSLKDYKPTQVGQIPDNVLYYAFYKLIENQIRGGR